MTVYCKFGTALEILTGKWKSLILLRLLNNGTMRFSELQKPFRIFRKDAGPAVERTGISRYCASRSVCANSAKGRILDYRVRTAHEARAPDNERLGAGHVRHMQKLYGEEDEAEAKPSDLRKIDSLR